jgi:hypothetical protein
MPHGDSRDRPEHNLDYVHEFARFARVPSRTSRRTAEELGLGQPQAEAFAIRVVASLTPECFAHSKFMTFENHKPPTFWADVYGVERDRRRFYVKFTVLGGQIVIYSCHFPEDDLVLQNGTIIKSWGW